MMTRAILLFLLLSPVLKAAPGLFHELWDGIRGRTIPECRESPIYYQAPSLEEVTDDFSFETSNRSNYLRRLRGTVTAPVTGNYIFWIASDGESQLWLSSDETKFHKELLAFAVRATNPEEYDKFFQQESRLVSLVAGESYYIEVFQKNATGDDHLSVAWTLPDGSGGREAIPSSALSPYVPDPLDLDDDDLLDSWEVLHNLDPADDGSEDLEMGPCGDPDRDGLDNLTEFLGQTNPIVYGGTPGRARLEIWTGVSAGSIDDFVTSPDFLEPPTVVAEGDIFDVSRKYKGNYFFRRRALLEVPATGAYTFAVAGDDFVQLSLSTSESKFDSRRIVNLEQPTGRQSWDELPSQLSEPIQLEAGQKYFVEILHKESLGADHVSVAWSSGGQPLTLIPSDAFTAFSRDLNDFDDDGLPDSWEMAHGLNPTDNGSINPINGALGDADGDGIDNLTECVANSFPGMIGGTNGKLTREVWRSIKGNSVSDLTGSPVFLLAPNVSEEIDGFAVPRSWGDDYGQRIRGTISPPTTGYYTFQIASDNNSELWLSENHLKYGRTRLASVAGATGPDDFERNPSQTSEAIYLVAGQRYYIEVLHKDGLRGDHVSIRWRKGEEPYDTIPSSAFYSHLPDPNDVDDDDLPDDWELSHGLDNSDNGRNDVRNGKFGDFDSDGLTNYEEYLRGFPPSVNGSNPGILARSVWEDVRTRGIPAWTSLASFPSNPTRSEFADSFGDLGEDFYGARYHGFIEVPESGLYTFWVGGDDLAEIWLGNDERPSSRRRIAHVFRPSRVDESDRFAEQSSVEIQLEADQLYHFEVLHIQRGGAEHLDISWSRDGSEREPIPFSAFVSPRTEPDDLDGDLLLDAWETAFGFDLDLSGLTELEANNYHPLSDPDRDFIPNYRESLFGSDPLAPDSMEQRLTSESWFDISYDSILNAFEQEPLLYEAANDARLLDSSTTGRLDRGDYFQRIRGYLTAPVAGNYQFWISGRTGIDLWLSSNGEKYRKKRIAGLSVEDGSGTGVNHSTNLRWDTYVGQMSEEVYLEEGETYYLEMLGSSGDGGNSHLSLAWALPGESREPVPASAFQSYFVLPSDQDDDCLPDAWEAEFGLSTTDNGLLSRSLEGERGDFDSDNLSNLEEYLLGTDPTLADTDGDGLNDFEEARILRTDPTVSDTTPEVLVGTIDLDSTVGFGSDWITAGDGSLLSTSFRGDGAWSFNVPADGHWVVQMSGRLRGDLLFSETLPIIVSIDGKKVERAQMSFIRESTGSIRILTPWLPAGDHTFEIFIDNLTTRRSLAITSIKILSPAGLDTDDSGLPDWADSQIAERSKMQTPSQLTSYYSPVVLEGWSPSLASVDVTSLNRIFSRESTRRLPEEYMNWFTRLFEYRLERYAARLQRQTRRGRGRMEGAGCQVQAGPGSNRWLSRIELRMNDVVGYVAQMENRGIYQKGTIEWVAANILEVNELTIPVGSKLLMGAWTSDWDFAKVTLDVEGQTHTFRARESHRHQFTTPGTFQVTATHQSGLVGTLTVVVRDAELPDHLVVGERRFFESDLPGVGPDLTFDVDGEVQHFGLTAHEDGARVRKGGLIPGLYQAATRLNEQHVGGGNQILAQTPLYVVGVSDAVRNLGDVVSPRGDGIFLVTSPLLVTNLPPGATVEADIFSAGVTFVDGTTTMTLTAADFDENGIFTFEFLKPAERLGAPCHNVFIYNDDGVRIYPTQRNP